ncbi:hypothetical protein Lesp02_22890 [Lentzea sp. NBRC 105346]|nr:hypothetical protein Lesp02_22890 [Lentzea sp. NBRC 105346]
MSSGVLLSVALPLLRLRSGQGSFVSWSNQDLAAAVLWGMKTLLALALTLAPTPVPAHDDVQLQTAGNCRFGTMWIVTGDWDGKGGDGVGFVDASGSTLKWTVRNALSAGPADKTFNFGEKSAAPLVGNWDGAAGDGIGTADTSKGAELQWKIRNSASAGAAEKTFSFGPSNSRYAVAGDWDGKSGDGIGVVVESGNDFEWRVRNSVGAGSPSKIFPFGTKAESAEVGNWDGSSGDGIATVSRGDGLGFKLRNNVSAGSANHSFNFGSGKTDCPVTGDWDGDGVDTVGIVRLVQVGNDIVREWQLRNSNSAGAADVVFRF